MNAVTPAVLTTAIATAHILVVDDAEKNTRLLADLLTAKGYRTSTAASGERALELVRADPPDLVLLDVMMPGMNGYEVCAALRADPEHALLPIVLVTALDPATERVKGMTAGADDFLSKPINQPELLARVKSLLRMKALHDELRRQRKELQDWREQFEQRVSDEVARRLRAGGTP
jgi:DNA-binding response OmpR family regulator